MRMTRLRHGSLSGLLAVSLALLVLPLLVAVSYGAVQLRELSKDSDRLLRLSVETARLTQQLFQDVTSLERSASLYAVLDDPRLGESYQGAQDSLEATLQALEAHPMNASVSGLLGHLSQEAATVKADLAATSLSPAERVSRVRIGFTGLWELASTLSTAHGEITDSRLRQLARETAATQRWLFAALAALLPAAGLLMLAFMYFVLRPLRQIDKAIAELGRGALTRPIAIQGPSDLEALGQQLEWLRTRLLELAQEKSRFLRHMSHELKTPLANIREGTDLLVDGAVGPLDGNQREVAGILQENALRLQQLIENLLSYSAWQSRSTQLDVSSFALNSLVGTVTDSQRLSLAARDITLDIDVCEIPVSGDRGKLKLVLENLMSNALKFTPRGGTIYLQGRRTGNQVVIDVADTGPGIPDYEHHRVFEDFFTGVTPQTGPLKGTGIGLAVVREFVQAHGGTVEIETGQFPGAHFRIYLPIDELREKPGSNHEA